MRRRNVTGVAVEPKGGDRGSVSPGLEKNSGLYRERDDSATITRLAKDSTTTRKNKTRLRKNRPSRPPTVVRETRPQRRQFCGAYFIGGTTLCDEVQR